MKTLTGWAFDDGFLKNLFPDAEPIPYFSHNFDSLKASVQGTETDVLVGWSLGGQVAARLISTGAIRTKLLVLIAAPYSLAGQNIGDFIKNFMANPKTTISDFRKIVAPMYGVFQEIGGQDLLRWLNEELALISCDSLDFSRFPRTVIIHGINDTVVPSSHAAMFSRRIKNSVTHMLQSCGHAPHIDYPEKIKSIIEKEA